MKNIVLKISSLLLGEPYDELKRETTKSKQKVMLYGTLLMMIMLLWFINGYLITNQILNYPNKQAIIVGIISAFIVMPSAALFPNCPIKSCRLCFC